jgi:Fe-S-cluster-containing dehydrogenase component
MTAQVIITDPKKCQACRICVLQCAVNKSKGKTLLAAIQEGAMPRIRVIGNEYAIPNICRHCESVCVANCPSMAIERTPDGVVRINEEKCIKCLLCLSVCPFEVIRIVEEAVTKCDLCYERLLEGKIPACVESCPVSALKFEKPEIVTERRFILTERFEVPPRRYDVKARAKETPKQIFERIKNIQRLARLFEVAAAVKRKREEFGLPPIPPEAVEDLKRITTATGLARKMAEVKAWMREG